MQSLKEILIKIRKKYNSIIEFRYYADGSWGLFDLDNNKLVNGGIDMLDGDIVNGLENYYESLCKE